MDFIVPLLEDLGMAFVEIGATFIDYLDQFDKMEIDTKALTDRAAARFVEGIHYGIIMIFGGLFSCLIHKIKSPYTRSIGASGVICGLLGVYIMIAISFKGLSALASVAPTLLIMVLMTASKKIDSIGHFTGLAVGLVCGFFVVSGII